MKLTELLSRYVFGREQRRRNRRRQAMAAQPAFVTLTDAQLEPRVLLSGTSLSADGEPDTKSSVLTVLAVDPGGEFAGKFGSEVLIASSIELSTYHSYVLVNGFGDVASQDRTFGSAVFTVPALTQGVNRADLQVKESASATATTVVICYTNFHSRNVLTAGNISSLDGGTDVLDLVAIHLNPIPPIHRSVVPAADSSGSATSVEHKAVTGSNSARLSSHVDAEATTTTVVIDSATPTLTAMGTWAAESSLRSPDSFFAESQNDLWAVDDDDAFVTAATPDQPANLPGTHGSEIQTASQTQADVNFAALNRWTAQTVELVRVPISARTSVFTTSASKAAFSELMNAFVQFDTFDLVQEDRELADWLSEQLGFGAVDAQLTNVNDAGTTATFADTNEVSQEEDQLQRLQQAFLKIDFESKSDTSIIALSEQPPDPPEVVGVWQLIRFDCNPRGPPASDQISSSEFGMQNANAEQLQQLRFSIAPRGPSVASVN